MQACICCATDILFLSISGVNIHYYQCYICGKTFTTKRRYQNHVDAHSHVRIRFHCKLCDKSYTRSDHLNNHIKLYHGTDYY